MKPAADTGAKQGLSGRRAFLGLAAAGAGGLLLAPGVHLMEVAQAAAPGTAAAGANPKVRWGLLIDTRKCASGCTDCVQACNTENGLSGGTAPTDAQWIRKIEIKSVKTGHGASLPVMCQHCAEPPCVDVCPTGASFKRADGIVLVDRHSCIGCRYCVMACPYQARSFVHEPLTEQKPEVPRGKGCVEGCTLCVHRIDKGGTPACVEACERAGHHAMLFGDLNDPDSAIAQRVREVATLQLRADLRLDPGVRYQGLT
ncbi:MAG: 4Fe-4S dicluster domain-containing protein [Burkholderiaceae bacterium]|nr:4Fe-4S dicluster domain-containing protein [Burkholderiaceae bacterium]